MQDFLQREVCDRSTEVVLDILYNGEVSLDCSSPWEDSGQVSAEVSQHRKATASELPAILEARRPISSLEILLECLLGSMSS